MQFTKMHGLGNDYVYVDGFRTPVPDNPAEISRRISDRHFGIGADGLILILPSSSADARMRMFNADGSESEMCGNGVRCVAKYVYDHGIAQKPELAIETGRGILKIQLSVHNGKVQSARVNMGEPILEGSRIPTTFPHDRVINQSIRVPSTDIFLEGTCVSMGNPHVVIYAGDQYFVANPEDLVVKHGSRIETAPEFPHRINVHFVKVLSRSEVTMRTWERGSGITLACGTGACAVCVAGVLSGRTDRQLLAHLPGGDLELEWSEQDNHVYMTGPAVEVFRGEWNG